MKIAIPSYKRADVLKQKTLSFLDSEGFPKEDITIFVANQTEAEIYKGVIGTDYTIVVGVPRISRQRSFIRNYYPEDELILSLDDDIKGIKFLRNNLDLKTLALLMFQICLDEGLTTWGIYPVNNLFFCKDRVLIGNFYIIGCCYGFINKKDMEECPLEVDEKEDFWYSLKRIELDGAVVRYDGACPDTTYYAKGGLAETRTLETERTAAEKVCGWFPGLTKFITKKNKHPDVKILRQIEKTVFINPM
jgi:hypothetical protein